jgi:hypothetical protein
MHPGNLVPSFYFYKLADALSSPYTSLSAYTSGIIDARGNIIKSESSIDPFEYLVIKLKKIIDQLPYGMTKASLGNTLSAIKMFSEEVEQYKITTDQFNCMMEGIFCQVTKNKLSYFELLEDMSVGAGGGAAGSLGTPIANSVGPGVAGFDPLLGMQLQKRKPLKYSNSCEIFDVDPDTFMQFKACNQWKNLPKSPTKDYLQRFQRRNKGKKLGVSSLNPISGEKDLFWINYTPENFMEDVNFDPIKTILENKSTDEVHPVDISGKEFDTTVDILQQRYEEEKQKEGKPTPYLKAGTAEKYATGVELERSMPRTVELMKRFGNRGEEIAREWHGRIRQSAQKPISRHGDDEGSADYFGIADVKVATPEDLEDMIVGYDAKNIKATGQVNLNPEEFFKETEIDGTVGFPKVNGVPAHIAKALAKEEGNARESARIQQEVLAPFFAHPTVQEKMKTHWQERHFPEQSSLLYRLAKRHGHELVPLTRDSAETLTRKGMRARVTRGGKQTAERSQIGIKTSSDFGVLAANELNPGPLKPLSPEEVRTIQTLGSNTKKFGEWLRTR